MFLLFSRSIFHRKTILNVDNSLLIYTFTRKEEKYSSIARTIKVVQMSYNISINCEECETKKYGQLR